MTSAERFLVDGQPSFSIGLMGILILLPGLLAAAALEKSGTHLSLPDEDSYRSPLSENLLESNNWRIPQEKKRDWRLPPPPPPLGWRTPQPAESESSSSQRTIELFPRFKSGKPSDYDMIEHEEKPLIKMFEFGSK
ncbi:MAG TPA: hypothetical protein PKK23_00215 [Nitrospirales bacterium]|nr:hypothetical protein [Nitrospiraceae bacterium]HNP27432.1 hypothetical protein [Nitrospirales bacterium]